MSNLEIYNQRFTNGGRQLFARALNRARVQGQNYVVVEHFIEALDAKEKHPFRLLAGLLKIDLDQVRTIGERLTIIKKGADPSRKAG